MSKTAKAQRETFLALLRTHPDLTLEQLGLFPRALLSAVRVGDLKPAEVQLSPAEVQVDRRLTTALELNGHDFDTFVLEVLREAGCPVAAAYLRERAGGPRWKLQGAMRRLAQAGLVARTGNGFGTRYRAIKKRSPHEKPEKPEHQVADLAAAE